MFVDDFCCFGEFDYFVPLSLTMPRLQFEFTAQIQSTVCCTNNGKGSMRILFLETVQIM